MFKSAPSWENSGTSMSLSPTRSGGSPARIAVASWLVSSLGDVTCITIFRFLCVALNSGINLSAAASVASLIQNVTVPVALTPKVDAGTSCVRLGGRGRGSLSWSAPLLSRAAGTTNFTITTPHGEPPSLER